LIMIFYFYETDHVIAPFDYLHIVTCAGVFLDTVTLVGINNKNVGVASLLDRLRTQRYL